MWEARDDWVSYSCIWSWLTVEGEGRRAKGWVAVRALEVEVLEVGFAGVVKRTEGSVGRKIDYRATHKGSFITQT
jgi:hypothetical protein